MQTHELMNYKLTGNYEDLKKKRSNFAVIAIKLLGLQVQESCVLGVWDKWEAGIFSIKLLCSSGMELKHNIPSVLCFPPKDKYSPVYVFCVGKIAKDLASQRVTEQSF